MTYCKWLLTLPSDDVNRFAYSDGTVWYLARGPVDEHDKKRASLGPSVWRMVDGKDTAAIAFRPGDAAFLQAKFPDSGWVQTEVHKMSHTVCWSWRGGVGRG